MAVELKGNVTVGLLTCEEKLKCLPSLTSILMMQDVGEVIVLENGYSSHLPKEFWYLATIARMRGIKFRYETCNKPIIESRRILIEEASNEYVLLADDDEVYEPDCAVKLKQALQMAVVSFGIVIPLVDLLSPDGESGLIVFDTTAGHIQSKGVAQEADIGLVKRISYGGCLMVKKGAKRLLDFADYGTDLGDDKYIVLNAMENGHRVMYEPHAVAYHMKDSIRSYVGGFTLIEKTLRETFGDRVADNWREAR